jgi:hypothetical protein
MDVMTHGCGSVATNSWMSALFEASVAVEVNDVGTELNNSELGDGAGPAGGDYRWPNGPDTTGGTTHDTKNTTRHEHEHDCIVSVSTRHDGRAVLCFKIDT